MKQQPIFHVLIAVLLSLSKVHAQSTAAGGPAGDSITGTALSVRQAVDLAIRNNLLVNQTDIQSQTSKVNLDQSYSNLLPNIQASASQGIGFGRTLITSSYTYTDQQTISGNYQVNANLTLFSGLNLQNSIKQYRYAYNASKMDLQQQKDNITLNVLLAYMQVLSSQDLLNIAREQADIDSKQLERLEGQNKEGALLLLSNLTDLRGQYAGDQANIAISTNNLEIAKVNLFQLMNVPYKRDIAFDANAFTIQIEDPLVVPDSIYQTALRTLHPSARQITGSSLTSGPSRQHVEPTTRPSLSMRMSKAITTTPRQRPCPPTISGTIPPPIILSPLAAHHTA